MAHRNKSLCGFCGKEYATTKDHIPPKSIFPKPRPLDLITIPSCRKCNNGSAILDEKFKAYLGLHVAQSGETGKNFFNTSLRTIKYNLKLKREIFSNTKPIGNQVGVLWDSDAHDQTIEKVIRGLFYYHYGKVIGDKAKVDAHWYKNPPKLNFVPNKESIAGGLFVYQHAKAEDTEFESIWLFEFYGGHYAGGSVSSI